MLYPFGFQAVLTRQDDPDVEVVYPCGSWFQPPRGWYRARVQGEWQISPFSLLMSYSGSRFRGRGSPIAIPVVDAGVVALPQAIRNNPHLMVRLLRAEDHLEAKFPRWELSRRKTVEEARNGLLMPAGTAIGALWDRQAKAYTAMSRPFQVKARATVEVPFERPREDQSFLVVQLQRAALATTAEAYGLKATAVQGGSILPPDLKVETADRIYAIWYSLRPGEAELRAESSREVLESRRIKLRRGTIGRLLARLEPRLAWTQARGCCVPATKEGRR